MPWSIKKMDGKFCIIKDTTGNAIPGGCHEDKGEAVNHLRALHANTDYALEISLESDEDYEAMLILTASGAETIPWSGIIAVEGIETGDHRVFAAGSITWDDPPLPLSWQRVSADGHKSSVVIGRVDNIERDGDSIKGNGVIFTGAEAPEEANQYRYLIENGAAGGVSVDGDNAQYDLQKDEDGKERISFNQMRIRALTAVAIPAFAEANIELDADTEELAKRKKKKKKIAKRSYSWADQDIILASAFKVKPPIEWFENPRLDGPTPLTVSKDGWVFGHIALFDSCHIGLPGCVKPPKNGSYQYFHTGEIETDLGDSVDIGHLTFRSGHAGHHLSAANAAAHYDNTTMVGADVRAGEDKFGIWVAGSMRPHMTDEDIREFRAAPISGDWRRIKSRMEMVGALSVNVPGFPVPRRKASFLTAGGELQTLIYSEDFGEILEEDLNTFSHIEIEARKALRAEFRAKVIELTGEYVPTFKTENPPWWDRPEAVEILTACADKAVGDDWYGPLTDTDRDFLNGMHADHEKLLQELSIKASSLSPNIKLYVFKLQEEVQNANIKIQKWLDMADAQDSIMAYEPQMEDD